MTSTDEFNAERDFPTYVERNPKAAEWDALMRTFQQQVPQAREGEWWAEMEMVFDLEARLRNGERRADRSKARWLSLPGPRPESGRPPRVYWPRKELRFVLSISIVRRVRRLSEVSSPRGAGPFVRADVGKGSQVKRVIERTLRTWGRLDILHNNAFWSRNAPATDLDEKAWDRTLEVTLNQSIWGLNTPFRPCEKVEEALSSIARCILLSVLQGSPPTMQPRAECWQLREPWLSTLGRIFA